MAPAQPASFDSIIADRQAEILADWLATLRGLGAMQSGRISEAELSAQCAGLLAELCSALRGGTTDPNAPGFTGLRDRQAEISASRGVQGFSAAENATFVMSIKQPIFAAVERAAGDSAAVALALRRTGREVVAMAARD